MPFEDRNGHLPNTNRNFEIKLFYKICLLFVYSLQTVSLAVSANMLSGHSVFGEVMVCRLVKSKDKTNTCQLIWCNIPADLTLQHLLCENLKPHLLSGILLRFLSEILALSSTPGDVKSGDLGGHTPLSNNLLLFRPYDAQHSRIQFGIFL